MGMSKKRKLKAVSIAVKQSLAVQESPMRVATAGGRIQVKWDSKSSATAMGQVVFFAEFLEATGLFDRWVAQCPLHYTSPNAPKVRDVLGTWLLSILDGQHRYAHAARLRGDSVAPQALGMSKIIGDESLRRGVALIAPAAKDNDDVDAQKRQQAQIERADKWMDQALLESVQYALDYDWILDIDTTIKTLFGHQSGAEISYNPHKPGRPSHAVHTYWVANLRLVLQACVQSGTSHSAAQTLPGLIELICRLPKENRPKLVRGDCAFGNERVMRELEEIGQHYLFKLKQSSNVKKLCERRWQKAAWRDVGQGWEAREDTLTLQGWTQARRVIVMRRELKDVVVSAPSKRSKASAKAGKSNIATSQQISLHFIDENAPAKAWEYAVLVTNSDYDVGAMGQLYRDRADCENGFDELKNQWGWGGYSTQDIERCNLSARAVALVYNWWSWYVRLANPDGRLEAITSRPLLLAAVGRITEHSGQTRILLSVTHAAVEKVKGMVAKVRKGLAHVLATAPQLAPLERWAALVRYIVIGIFIAEEKKRAKTTAGPALATG
jgi:Transposase DDE domain group 1